MKTTSVDIEMRKGSGAKGKELRAKGRTEMARALLSSLPFALFNTQTMRGYRLWVCSS
jgi:hypothetical protein